MQTQLPLFPGGIHCQSSPSLCTPVADPSFKPTTNPSDIIVPDQMKKMAPAGGVMKKP
jgi:hypothetical protein